SGAFGGATGFTFTTGTNTVTVGDSTTAGTITTVTPGSGAGLLLTIKGGAAAVGGGAGGDLKMLAGPGNGGLPGNFTWFTNSGFQVFEINGNTGAFILGNSGGAGNGSSGQALISQG
ncbi:hypothetical protein JNW93_14785, partial [Lacticaseibacillus rhamnosus]|nr:hypothetical protein [Lacticaseibacillus rhamnosus]